jgi:photosystem II stability/assembly factor-like uncharacterized protein
MVAATLALVVAACAPAPAPEAPAASPSRLVRQESGTTALLQAVSVVDERVVWVSGHRGTYAITTDGGEHWRAAVMPGEDSLQFRDVHAVDARTAYLLAAGPGDRSRIYKTGDGGATWRLQFVNRDSTAFFDCFDFWDATHGIAFSDASNGRFPILTTTDGEHWEPIAPAVLPPPLPNEGGFAASGRCVVTGPGGRAWIGTGSLEAARVLRSGDAGTSWSVAVTPVVHGQASGIAALAFRDTLTGVALGGPIAAPDSIASTVAITRDGGRSWVAGGRPTFRGAVYGAAYVPGGGATLVAVGPNGASRSHDDGRTWVTLDTASYWSLGFAARDIGWLVGPDGRIVRVSLR